jgi:hypothetical protein
MKKSGPRKDGKTNERSECVGGHRPHGEKRKEEYFRFEGRFICAQRNLFLVRGYWLEL